jgi:hypothetical protein
MNGPFKLLKMQMEAAPATVSCYGFWGGDSTRYAGPKCPSCGSRRTKRLAEGYPVRQCCDCGRSSLYGELIPEKEPK